MADKTITALTAATKLDGTEVIHGVQGVNSRKITSAQLAALDAPIVTDATTARVLAIGDVGSWIEFTNGAAITVTINTGIFSAGDIILFEQGGVGVMTFTAGAGFTLDSASAAILSNGQFTTQGIKFKSGTNAILFGNIV